MLVSVAGEAHAPQLQDQWGMHVELSDEELDARYFPIHGALVYKPKFAPVQAFCPSEETEVDLPDGTRSTVMAGDAVLRKADGAIELLPRHDFNRRYRVLGAFDERPGLPEDAGAF